MEVHSGAILAAASAPRFDPNLFAAAGDADSQPKLQMILDNPAHPLFDRTCRMALPPGSVFKPVTAAALLESDLIQAEEPLHCRGYLHRPDSLRCQIYARQGTGHGAVNLTRALATSCNVYFFQHAETIGGASLVDWANRFGLGRTTGIDLPAEAAGHVPRPGNDWATSDTQALAIGQHRLTVTPLQMARAMAALANGGLLVQPHFVNSITSADSVDDPAIVAPQPIEGLTSATLESIRSGLKRVVADPEGTAHETVSLSEVTIAGKTGTAETGGGKPDHAWFAGYAPAEAPKVAIVVVLEHAGQGSLAAGPVARRVIERMYQFGYFHRSLKQMPAGRASRRMPPAGAAAQ
jgi:penicillin-binding protein 2